MRDNVMRWKVRNCGIKECKGTLIIHYIFEYSVYTELKVKKKIIENVKIYSTVKKHISI